MSDLTLHAPPSVANSKHYDFFRKHFSDCFQTTSPDRVEALARVKLKIEQWHTEDTTLKDTNKAAWSAQNEVDRALNTLQDVSAFAAPLLQARLKEKYGVTDDVRETYLRLYIPRKSLWEIADPLGGVTTRTVSLLDAALHNFAASESFEEKDSAYISQPDQRGHFTIKPVHKQMTIRQFQTLCRELNIGAQYSVYLNKALQSGSAETRQDFKKKVIASEKAAFKTAAAMALLKGDISENAHSVLTGLLAGRKGLTLIGKVTEPCDLSLLGTTLTGIVIFGAVAHHQTGIHPIVAYIPHDPEHPLKQYASWKDFVRELSRQLRENAVSASSQMTYRQFFSQFVDQNQRGHFFAALDQRLSTVTWHPKEPLDQRPSWRDTPVEQPDLQYIRIPFSEDIAERLYQRKLDKILKDARDIAISTADADSQARKAWWDNFLKVASDIFNAALLVVTPFVPILGELMLAYTAYQLGSEVITGVVDLVEGQWVEATEHLIGVLNALAQMAAVGAGFVIGKPLMAKLSELVDGMIPVRLASGETRLWNPDLTPYEQKTINLPSEAKPDANGLHRYEGKQILRAENKHYEVSEDAKNDQHRIQHPTRSEAYQPELKLNGSGAHVIEGEQPRTWDNITLLRRLGPSVAEVSDAQLETARLISGTDPGELRRMYVENREPPVLLTDTLSRLFDADYVSHEDTTEQFTLLVRGKFPDIPAQGIKNLLATATEAEQKIMTDEGRIPLRLKRIARELQLETRTARGYEGFYRESQINADTERLTLNALRLFSDALSDLRIEIRTETFDGELSTKAGPADASVVRILVKGKQNTYEVRDTSNKKLHDGADLYQSILRALPDEKLKELGYRVSEGAMFKQWVMVKTEAPAERRTTLDPRDPPLPPPKEDLLLLRGALLSSDPKTVIEYVADLYPHLSEREADTFIKSLQAKGSAIDTLEHLEKELDNLRDVLDRWHSSYRYGNESTFQAYRNGGGQHIQERLIECFERKTSLFGKRSAHLEVGYTLDLSGSIGSGQEFELWWQKLPNVSKYLEQITSLKVDRTLIDSEAGGLLKDFPQLRQLTANGCELKRIPEAIGRMQLLETLHLNDNNIELRATDVESLKNLTRLQSLRLDDNPLKASVNVSRMPRLKVLSLNNTGIDSWPEGLFSKRRPRGFFLDMLENNLARVPQVAPASNDAFIVARTRISPNRLSEVNQTIYESYRKSVGITPRVLYDAAVDSEMTHWKITRSRRWDFSMPEASIYRDEAWFDLNREAHSKGFFQVIKKLRQTEDYLEGGEPRIQLTERVWQMIDAAYMDSSLRDDLFIMATAPTTCADAGAQLFNNMGIKVLVSEAYSFSLTADELENSLVSLAKGASRLEQVNQIARADIVARQANPDEVEVHLAYETGLAQRLDLPLLAKSMRYREIAGVNDNAIDQAYDTVISLEQGDGLVNGMLEQKFWSDYLRERHPGEFEQNEKTYARNVEQLEELREVQQEWADAASLPEAQKEQLKEKLKSLAHPLSVPESVVFTGEPMTDQTYERVYRDLGDGELELSRRLTRAALKKAGL